MSDNIESTLSQSMTSVLRNMQESMSGEINAIQGQTHQIESLLKDAIAALHEAFGSIHEASDQQMKVMTGMMMEVVGATDDINIFQKAENASEILTGLVDTLLLSSKNNLRALTAMDSLQGNLQHLAELDQEQQALMVQLCECGKAEQVDVEKMRQLSQLLLDKQHAQTEFTIKTMASFKKTHQLIDSVASKDMVEVFAAKDKVESILQHFFQINELVTNTRVQVNQVNADMRKHLGSAIRALQFEDISSQSLGHTDRHLGRMAGMIAILTEGLANLDQSGITIEAYVAGIASIHGAMSAYHQTLQLEDSNPISQENMDEGDIDLF
ncbi:MAG: hypothetical protein Q9M14_05435 [Mariprofundaceae bacterium]|nr:hypothetical protein [Mariprofundaceae bacterium]